MPQERRRDSALLVAYQKRSRLFPAFLGFARVPAPSGCITFPRSVSYPLVALTLLSSLPNMLWVQRRAQRPLLRD
jgi:hypothetical protein